MATERINTIVKEVIELDPSLREHEASLRTFIERMDEARPNVPIDTAFIAELRKRILTEKVRTPSPYANISWWALRLMPIGAVALLLLMLVPPTPFPNESRSIPEMTASDPRILDIEMGGTTEIPPPPIEQYGIGVAEDVSTESAPSMSLKSVVTEQTVQTFTIPPQIPGLVVRIDTLTVEEPSFVVIDTKTTAGELIIGTSPLLLAGTVDGLSINLMTRMDASGVYRAVLYSDNGDQIFTREDLLTYDRGETPMSVPIVLVPE